MNVASVPAVLAPTQSATAVSARLQPQLARAPDGDTPAVEAAESAATRKAESQNGGIAPKAATTASTSGINIVV